MRKKRLVHLFYTLALLALGGIGGMRAVAQPVPEHAKPADNFKNSGIEVVLRDGARSLMRDAGSDVHPIGEKDFLYTGAFESNKENHTFKIGDTEMTGYAKDPWQPGSVVVPPKVSCGYLARMTPEGKVKWHLVMKDGKLVGLQTVTANEETYLLFTVKPINRLHRPAEDKTLVIWENQNGEQWKIEKEEIESTTSSNFDERQYAFIMKILADGTIDQSTAMEIKLNNLITPKKSATWLLLSELAIHEGRLRLIGRLNNAVATFGEGAAEDIKELTSPIPGSNYNLFFAEFDGKKCTKAEFVNSNGEVLKSLQTKSVLQTADGLYVSLTISRNNYSDPQNISLFGTQLEAVESGATNLILKIANDLSGIEWQKRVPKRATVNALAHYGDSLYATGDYSSTITWGESTLDDLATSDGTGFWGTMGKSDGEFGYAKSVKTGFSDGKGIAVDRDRVYWAFWFNSSYFSGTEAPKHFELNFGNGNIFPFPNTEDYGSAPNVGFAAYARKTGEFVTYSPLCFSDAYIDMLNDGPIISNDGTHFCTTVQSGTNGSKNIRDIQIFGEFVQTPHTEFYGGFINLLQNVRIQNKLTIKAEKKATVTVTWYDAENEVSHTETVENEERALTIRNGLEFQMTVASSDPSEILKVITNFDPALVEKRIDGADTYYKLKGDASYSVTTAPKPLNLLTATVQSGAHGSTILTWKMTDGSTWSETISGETKEVKIAESSTVTVTANPETHYKVANITVGTNAAFQSGEQFTLTEATEINVTFERIAYKFLSLNVTGEGEVKLQRTEGGTTTTLEKDAIVYEGETLQLLIEPGANSILQNSTFKTEGLEKQPDDSYRVIGDISITADFERIAYKFLSLNVTGEGEVKLQRTEGGTTTTLEKDAIVYQDETLQLLIEPGANSILQNNTFKTEGLEKQLDDSYKVTGDIRIAAEFVSLIPLTIQSGEHGETRISWINSEGKPCGDTISNGEKVVNLPQHTSVTVVAMPEALFHCESITVGNNAGFQSGETFTLNEATVVKVIFARNKFVYKNITIRGEGEVKLQRTEGGTTTTLEKGATVYQGEMLQLNIKSAENFTLRESSFKADGLEKQADGSSYKVTGDITITADFDPEEKTPVLTDGALLPELLQNPVIELIRLGNASDVNAYALINLNGQTTLSGEHNNAEELQIDATSLQKGLYLLRVQISNGQWYTLKVMKQ